MGTHFYNMFGQVTRRALHAAAPHVAKFMKTPQMQKRAVVGMTGAYGFTSLAEFDRLHKEPVRNLIVGSIGGILGTIGGEILIEFLPFRLMPIAAPIFGIATLHNIYS